LSASNFVDTVAKLLNIPGEQIKPLPIEEQEELYTTAYHLYEQGDFVSSAQLFTHLIYSDTFSTRYWQGLAASKQMHKDYAAALNAWSMAALLHENDPWPHYHAAECLLSQGEIEEACKALIAAEGLLTEQEKDLKQKIAVLKMIHFTTA